MHNCIMFIIGVRDVIEIPDSVRPGTRGIIKTRLFLDVHKVYIPYIGTYMVVCIRRTAGDHR